MNNVNKTLYIPLYGKAYVSKKGIILNDKKAEEIWSSEMPTHIIQQSFQFLLRQIHAHTFHHNDG